MQICNAPAGQAGNKLFIIICSRLKTDNKLIYKYICMTKKNTKT